MRMREAHATLSRVIEAAKGLAEACETLVESQAETDPMAAGMMLGCAHEMAVAALAAFNREISNG